MYYNSVIVEEDARMLFAERPSKDTTVFLPDELYPKRLYPAVWYDSRRASFVMCYAILRTDAAYTRAHTCRERAVGKAQ